MSIEIKHVVKHANCNIYGMVQTIINSTIYIFYAINNQFEGSCDLYVAHTDLNYDNVVDHFLLKYMPPNSYTQPLGVKYDSEGSNINLYYATPNDGNILHLYKMTISTKCKLLSNQQISTFGLSNNLSSLKNNIVNNNKDSKILFGGTDTSQSTELIYTQIISFLKDGTIRRVNTVQTYNGQGTVDGLLGGTSQCDNPYNLNDIVVSYLYEPPGDTQPGEHLPTEVHIVLDGIDHIIFQTLQGEVAGSTYLFTYNNKLYLVVAIGSDSQNYIRIIEINSSGTSTAQKDISIAYSGSYPMFLCSTNINGVEKIYNVSTAPDSNYQNHLLELSFSGDLNSILVNDIITEKQYNSSNTLVTTIGKIPSLNEPKLILASNEWDNEENGMFSFINKATIDSNDYSYDPGQIINDDGYDISDGNGENGSGGSSNGSNGKTKIYLELQSLNSTNIKIPFKTPTPMTSDGSAPQWLLQFRCKIYSDEACTDLIAQLNTIDNRDAFKLENNIDFPANGLPPNKYDTKCFVSANIRPVNRIYVVLDYGAETY